MRKSRFGAQPVRRPPTLRRRRRTLDSGRATTKIRIMDIEHINAIGKHIADLSERTTALRGYL
jgi:hypothetical protein